MVFFKTLDRVLVQNGKLRIEISFGVGSVVLVGAHGDGALEVQRIEVGCYESGETKRGLISSLPEFQSQIVRK